MKIKKKKKTIVANCTIVHKQKLHKEASMKRFEEATWRKIIEVRVSIKVESQ